MYVLSNVDLVVSANFLVSISSLTKSLKLISFISSFLKGSLSLLISAFKSSNFVTALVIVLTPYKTVKFFSIYLLPLIVNVAKKSSPPRLFLILLIFGLFVGIGLFALAM